MGQSVDDKLICLAAVAGVHGVRGALKLRCFTQSPENVTHYGPVYDRHGRELFQLKAMGSCKGGVIVQACGITDRDQALALKGTELFVPRDRLPEADEDEFYYEDLIGLQVLCEGEPLGQVKQVDDFGASAVLEIATKDDKVISLPFTREIVPEIDLSKGTLTVCLPDEVTA